MKIVFWNINKDLTPEEIGLMGIEIDPDIIFFAECKMGIAKVLLSLNSKSTKYFYNMDPVCTKIKMFSKFRDKYVSATKSNIRYTVREVNVPTYPKFNLMCLHYQSKVNWDFADQASHSMELNTVINDFEKKTNNSNSVIIGDFNMNPFDFGMVQTTGLHSVMSKEVAKKNGRVVDGKTYPFFYNPMWSFFGDKGKGDVNGTIYNTLSKPINYFWNIFDQVLVRPQFIDHFDEDELEIITKLGDKELLKQSGIIDDTVSDHLPISIKIKR